MRSIVALNNDRPTNEQAEERSGVSLRQVVCGAITAKQLLAFRYEGFERVVEPHLCGRNEAGHDVLQAWFVRGYSQSEARAGWRTYLLSEMHEVRALHDTFEQARNGFNPNGRSIRLVYCHLTRDTA
jgi:hypothetical protein